MNSPYLPPVMSDVVIDLSHYNNINADFVAASEAGVAAVILKATQGAGFVDPTFLEHAAEARTAGLLVGAYHFLDGSNSSLQITHFLTIAQSEAGVDWLALDWEPYPTSQATLLKASVAVGSIKALTGKWPTLYMIRSMLSASSQTLSNCPLWLAEYGTRPICPPGFSEWKLWQHTDGQVGSAIAPVPGIGFCSRSKFAGTADQLRAWWPVAGA